MPTYSVIIRGDENSLNIKDKIETRLSKAGYLYNEEEPETIFVVGGDGTFLKAIHQYAEQLNEIQFIGIHTGTLGFMCDYQIEDVDELLEMFIHQQPRIFNYSVLQVELENLNKTIYAFNEIRIENIINTLTMDLWINDEYFEKFKGTGICLCTQIGSTAVNRSLGGAVIQHGLPLLELSEIAGVHHWKHRSLRSSLILKEDAVIRVKPETFNNTFLCYDHESMQLDHCTGCTIKNSPYQVRIARYKQYSYLKRLKNVF
ncbi:MAG: NAD(+)/NADH kinase [Erysipelotrichaceae bacterium]|nr:NAD(+)/NADH kinase [Erysipelotrichaceae bacterium]MBQ7889230.1 NAD(+)/NADH kinase [Erysipelotrichaceae bacterium]